MFAYIGCRTSQKRNARGKGIEVYRVSGGEQRWEHVETVPHEHNPSFLALSADQRFLYTVHGDHGEVSAYAVDPATGRLAYLNTASTEGRNLVHLAIDRSGRWLVVSNHLSQTVASLPILPDGRLGKLACKLEITGTAGPWTHHQTGPKPHHNPFSPAGDFLLVADKGIDEILALGLAPGSGALCIVGRVRSRRGAGPRHVDFHPSAPYFYAINELDSTIGVYRHGAGGTVLEPVQVVPSLPDTFTAKNTGAEVWVDGSGRFVYVSNRGHESIGVFAIDPASGRLDPVQWAATQGSTPRFFALSPDGSHLYACNEDSDTIVQFAVDRERGTLEATPQVLHTGSPACIVFRA